MFCCRFASENSQNTVFKTASVGRQRSGDKCGAKGLETQQGLGKGLRRSGHSNRLIIATVFTIDPHLARKPPGRRMKKDEDLDQTLKQVDPVIVASDVRQLVGKDGSKLFWSKGAKSAGRYDDDWLQPTDHHGRFSDVATDQPNGLIHAELFLERFEGLQPMVFRQRNFLPPQPSGPHPGRTKSNEHSEHTESPTSCRNFKVVKLSAHRRSFDNHLD